jgi:hypothetical protein
MMVLWLKAAPKAGNHMLLKTGHFHFGRNRTFSLWLDMLDEGLDFLQKPFSMNDLAYKVRQTLERK